MKRQGLNASISRRFDRPVALICFLFFALGSAAGTISGSSLSSSAMVVANSVQNDFFGYINGFSFIFRFVGLSILCCITLYIFSLSVVGFVSVVPILFIKGFSLSYSCAAVIVSAGHNYIAPLIFFTLCDIIICIPVLIYCAVFCARYSFSLTYSVFSGKSAKIYNSGYFKSFGFCSAALILAGLIQRFIIPILPAFQRLHL